jgi:hypothetical protein
VPVAKGDVVYLREKHKELNQMLADQAAANGAGVVDRYTRASATTPASRPASRGSRGPCR